MMPRGIRLWPRFAGACLWGFAYYDSAINVSLFGQSGQCYSVPAVFDPCVPGTIVLGFRWAVVAFYVVAGAFLVSGRWKR